MEDDIFEARPVEANVVFTLRELCRSSGVDVELVVQMVEVGLLEPAGREREDWRFPSQSLARVQSTLRLRRDLDVNLSGAALALELLDELQRLRERVRVLERQIGNL